MRSFLLQPYPFSDNAQNKVVVCGGIGLFIAFFLAVFEPFGFDDLRNDIKWKHAFAFGAVTFLVTAFFQIVLPEMLPALFREEEWRSWKEILYLLVTTVFIGVANYALMVYLYPQDILLTNFFRAQLVTLQVGIFPILFIVFMKQMALYRRYVAEAKQTSAEIATGEEEGEPVHTKLSAPKFILRGDNQNEELSLSADDIFFIASADNYVKVQHREGGQLKQAVLRGTLKKLEDQLSGYPQFFRCHRMFLVNLNQVKEVSGNAQGLKLHLSGLEEAIPVSRSLNETVRERLHRVCHSPQSA